MAQCIETQLILNESFKKSLNTCRSVLLAGLNEDFLRSLTFNPNYLK